jgi:cathepsin D
LSDVTLNGAAIEVGDHNLAVIDTSTALIGGPTAAVQAIWASIPNAVPLTGNMTGYYSFRTSSVTLLTVHGYTYSRADWMNPHAACTTQLTMSIAFGGPAWPINVADLSVGTIGKGQCLGAIFDLTASIPPQLGLPAWVVGDSFLVRFFLSLVLMTGFA